VGAGDRGAGWAGGRGRGTDPAASRALASCTARPLGPSRKRGILREPCARNTLMSAAPTWGPDIMANATVETPLVRFEVEDSIGVITIDNPPVNALGPGVRDGIIEALQQDASA